ncbi:MAG TPA: endonuclease/exonuclease/phosphatase family protein [Gemmatimonadales bacterium]|nr:endonuclease/exonuclease/phosphatase family protein [Gemmatimonadales bacterium]
MSYNIRYGTAQDGAHVWPNRREFLIAVIHDHAPHILGVQEALSFQLGELRAALPGHMAVGVGRDDGIDQGEYAAILVDTARFEVVSSGTTWFSDTPTVPGSTSWGNTIPRITTWALLRDRSTDHRTWVYNLHLDHISQPSREKSVQFLLAEQQRRSDSQRARDANAAEFAGAQGEPGLIVMGDFNSGEDNPAFHIATQGGLRSALRVIHPDTPYRGTFTGFGAAADPETGVIDHIMVDRSWQVLSSGFDSRKFGATWPSDHFPVWATVEMDR